MKRGLLIIRLLACAAALSAAVPASAQSAKAPGPWGRVSFTADGSTAADQSGNSLPGFTEMVTAVTFASPYRETSGTDYRVDFRTAAYPGVESRDTRMSIYDAYVGQRMAGGSLNLRVGQMWLNDLGGLGSLGGFLAEVRLAGALGFHRVRIGVFGGLEPQPMAAAYVDDVRKGGAYVAFEGQGAWRDVVGFVTVRDGGLTERSVITTTNFLPFGKTFMVYQAAEFDLTGPGGRGSGGLTYFFANANWRPGPRFELQGTFHRGWSIDSRTITQDLLNGRPVAAQSLDGMLYESMGSRVTVTVFKNVRVFAGLAHDRSNQVDSTSDRVTFGVFTPDLLGTGLDVRVSDDRVTRATSSYDGWDASIGRTFARRFYLSAEYSSSLSIVQVTALGGFNIQSRPRTRRYALMGNVYFSRWLSLMLSAEQLRDDTLREFRWISGITSRF